MANFKEFSRYSGRIIDENRAKNNFLKLRESLDLTEDAGDDFVEVTDELRKRPDLLAWRAYGDHSLWWVIYEFNEIRDPLFEITIGQILRIPQKNRVFEAIGKLKSERNRSR